MNKSVLKREVADLLRKRDFINLLERCESNRQYWQEVRFRLYDLDEVLRWTAIETAGKLMKKWWDAGNEEKVRVYIRTLFWSLNEESGGIGWSSAQTIAEIIAMNPLLIDPYGSMMIAYCIDEPSLLKGCFWGIGRLGGLIREAVTDFRDRVCNVFESNNPEILGIAAWAMGEAGIALAAPYLGKLRFRSEPVTIYIEGNFWEKSLGQWVDEALMNMKTEG